MAEYICADLSERPGCKVSPFWERRERVVRCRNCRRSFEERGELWCRGIVGPPIEPDGFCSWGEPREEA